MTCEGITGSILFWDVSIPHLAIATTQRIIVPASPGIVLSPDFNIGVTEFNVTISLTISYNTQYNVSIVSSLCGVTTTKVLNYGK